MDRTFADVQVAFDLWQKINENVDLSQFPAEVIEQTNQRMSIWLEGFMAAMDLKLREKNA